MTQDTFYRTVDGKSMGIDQREFLKHLASIVTDRFSHPVIINIGVLLGCSLACLRAGSPTAAIIGIDIDLKHRSPSTDCLNYAKARLVECDSREFAKMFEEEVHLVFVNGGHSYTTAKNDLIDWSSKIVGGGIVAIHDLHMGTVHRAFSEWYDAGHWKEVIGSPCPGFRAFEKVETAEVEGA